MEETNARLQSGKGLLLCLLFYIAFYAIAVGIRDMLGLRETSWFIFSSVQRIVFGAFELWLFMRIFGRKSVGEFINTHGLKSGFKAGLPLLIFTGLVLVTLVSGIKKFAEISPLLVVSRLFLQQLATGFWEEMNFRGMMCEGYWHSRKKTPKLRLIFGLLSFAIFGMIHAVEGDGLSMIVYTFMTTGTIGFCLAAMYLHSGSLLAPMITHFVYDIFANLHFCVGEWRNNVFFDIMNDWALPAFYVVIFAVSVVYLLKEPFCKDNRVVHNAEITADP